MASLTPTFDPVTASPMPPVSDPIAASDRRDKPIMGNIVSVSRDEWSAWTGSKPDPGSIRAPPMTSRHQTNSASQKGYNFHRTGMTNLFTQVSSLVDFQNAVWDHLTDCGMDTIAYPPIQRTPP